MCLKVYIKSSGDPGFTIYIQDLVIEGIICCFIKKINLDFCSWCKPSTNQNTCFIFTHATDSDYPYNKGNIHLIHMKLLLWHEFYILNLNQFCLFCFRAPTVLPVWQPVRVHLRDAVAADGAWLRLPPRLPRPRLDQSDKWERRARENVREKKKERER